MSDSSKARRWGNAVFLCKYLVTKVRSCANQRVENEPLLTVRAEEKAWELEILCRIVAPDISTPITHLLPKTNHVHKLVTDAIITDTDSEDIHLLRKST